MIGCNVHPSARVGRCGREHRCGPAQNESGPAGWTAGPRSV